MKHKLSTVLLAVAMMSPVIVSAQTPGSDRDFRKAVDLYGHGMYERARGVFDDLAVKYDDPLAEGWSVLCAIRMKAENADVLADEYLYRNPYSTLASQIHFQTALEKFDRGDYASALDAFARVNRRDLDKSSVPELDYKRGYAYFEQGDYDAAAGLFGNVDKMPKSDYTAPARYALGYIDYAEGRFADSYSWFEQAGRDPRFSQMAGYYMLECRFMQKDYKYVTDNGPKLFNEVPEERRPHLARIISESFLVSGDAGTAKEYYEKNVMDGPSRNRKDYFYAGSLMYALGDYPGAIDNYTKMDARVDSLGQAANYNLGYSYIQTRNKVAAMDAFKDASAVEYDKKIQEDAWYNWAKLAFDLNHDPSVFNSYMEKYPELKKNDQIYSYIALGSLYSHDYAGAVAAYDNIDYLDEGMRGNYKKANYLRANQLIENGSWSAAVPCLRAASFYGDRHDGFNQLSRWWLGEAYFRSDKLEEARSTFTDLYNNSALEGKAEGELIPYNLGYCYFRDGDWQNAAKWFDLYLSSSRPANGRDAATRRADCDFIRKDYKEAIAQYDKVISGYDNSDDLYPYYQRGLSYGLLGDKAGKVKALSYALDADPSSAWYNESLYELGRAYVANSNPDDASRCFKLLKANTNDETFAARSLIELGMLSRNKGEDVQALGYYKQVVSSYASTGLAEDAMSAIEAIYQSRGETDAYLEYIDKSGVSAGKTEEQKEMMYFTAAEQLYLNGNYERALASLDTYFEKYPSGSRIAEADFYAAECHRQLGRKEQACAYYEKVMSFGRKASYLENATRSYSDLSYGMENYSDAFRGYSSLLDAAGFPSNKTAARLGMMRSAFRGGMWNDAIASADAVVSGNDFNDDQKREALHVQAKSYLSSSRRDQAMPLLKKLSEQPATGEGAEATYLLIQNSYDQGLLDEVEKQVYKFSSDAPDQSYWLAKSYIVLGDSFVDKDSLKQAKATFESIRDGYVPVMGMADDVLDNVNMRLVKLEKLLNEQ